MIMKNKVAFYRKKQNITQRELAKIIGVSRQTIILIESEKYNPTLKLCLKLSKVLKTNLNNLFGS